MTNRTNTSAPYYSYEYYLDYVDLIPVDEKKLKANKYSIVIAFWVSLVAFVLLLFLILLYMSWSGSPHTRNSPQQHQIWSWNPGLNLPFCLRRASQETVEESGSRAEAEQQLQQDSTSATLATDSTGAPALLWHQALDAGPHGVR